MSDEQPRTVDLSGARITFVPADPAAGYSLSEWSIPPGWQSPPIHVHHETDEGFYVMAGRFGFVLDGVTVHATAGAHVLAPKGHPHSFWNAGRQQARCLLIVSPPGLEEYFRSLAMELVGAASPEASMAVRKKLSERFDMEVVGPFPEVTSMPDEGD